MLKKNAEGGENKGTHFVHRNSGRDKRTYKEVLKGKIVIQEHLINAKTVREAKQQVRRRIRNNPEVCQEEEIPNNSTFIKGEVSAENLEWLGRSVIRAVSAPTELLMVQSKLSYVSLGI